MEGPASVNGRASGRTARERSDRKRAKKRSRRDLLLRFDDVPSPAYDDSFYRVPVDRKRSRSHGIIWDSGYDSSDAAGVDGLLCVCIAVEIFPLQGEKQLASSRSARIRGDTG